LWKKNRIDCKESDLRNIGRKSMELRCPIITGNIVKRIPKDPFENGPEVP
jgi:hypothetical protein